MATDNAVPPLTASEKEANGINGINGTNGINGINGNHRHWHHHGDNANITTGYAQASGGSLNPGLWKPYEHRKFANPAPLGLCAFALTTFVLSAVNTHTRGVKEPNIVVPLAFGYGGLVQLLAGMWEIACGNTFGATALSSYGGFWISYAILLTPNWGITSTTGPYEGNVSSPLGFFLTGWFIFTTLLVISCEQYANDMGNTTAAVALQKTGGVFGFLAAFLAWYCALAGLQDSSNSFFQVPVFHFPWSDKGREDRKKTDRTQA